MIKRVLTFSIFWSILTIPTLGALSLSSSSELSILTFSPGVELYTSFGHTAFRVHDEAQGIDYVFNYGTFDFNAPNFYLNFVRGRLDYQLSVDTYENYFNYEVSTGREIQEQVLDLTLAQRQRIVDALVENYKPENRHYAYDFFYDNCSTRIRDVLEKFIGTPIDWGDPRKGNRISYRQGVDFYLKHDPWSNLGINLLLGQPTDALTDVRQEMWLPYSMRDALNSARIQRDGATTNLVKVFHVNYKPDVKPQPPLFWTPEVVLWTLFVLVGLLSFFEFRRNRLTRFFDIVFFFFVGILGSVIFFLWFLSDHNSVRPNWNWFWSFGPQIVLAFFLLRQKRPLWLRRIFLVQAVLAVLAVAFLAFGSWMPQHFDLRSLPLILICAVRAFCIFRIQDAGKSAQPLLKSART